MSSSQRATVIALTGLCFVGFTWLTCADGDRDRSTSTSWPGFSSLQATGVHNLFALGTKVYSGSSPQGREGFVSLAQLGVKTIITVDGATPDVETARNFGMRYVHLPHGYDGISRDLQLILAKVGREVKGPVYVHCHHGKHRGPTAAAVLCMAEEGWSREQAEAFLVVAGASTNYAGLYETIRMFQAPTMDQLSMVPSEFPETASVSGLVEAMVSIDERWEHLRAVRAAGYRAPPGHPDIEPVNEVVILWEHFREAQRLPEVIEKGADLIQQFSEAEIEARETEGLLRKFGDLVDTELKTRLDEKFDAMDRSCSSCHKVWRNPVGIKAKH